MLSGGILYALTASLAAVRLIGAFSPIQPPATVHECNHPSSFTFIPSSLPLSHSRHNSIATAFAAKKNDVDVAVEEWTSVTEDGGVKMRIISSPKNNVESEATEGDAPFKGKDATVEYIGSIAPRNWSVNDVLDCWLPDQGLTALAPELFKAFEIDGAKLTDAKRFNKKFIFEGLGVLKEAKINTLYEAAQSLKQSEQTHVEGTVFDKNQFTFRLGKGMSIRAFDLAIEKMKVGETALLVARCDYAYGSRGLRAMGKVLVPPYQTVQYEVTLLEIK